MQTILDCSVCLIHYVACTLCPDEKKTQFSVTDYPAKTEKKGPTPATTVVCVVQRVISDNSGSSSEDIHEYLIVQRPSNGLLASMWEFPSILLAADEEPIESQADVKPEDSEPVLHKARMREYLGSICPSLTEMCAEEGRSNPDIVCKPIGQLEHIFTHIKMTYIAESLIWRCKSSRAVQERVMEGTFQPDAPGESSLVKGKPLKANKSKKAKTSTPLYVNQALWNYP